MQDYYVVLHPYQVVHWVQVIFLVILQVFKKSLHTQEYLLKLTLQFYVDKDYKIIKLFENWMDYITSGSEKQQNSSFNKSDLGYFYRMRYPRGNSGYKCDKTKIVKFNVDYRSEIEYTFFGLFPINFSSTPVQYGSSDVLKASVTFSYERYIAGKETSLAYAKGDAENLRKRLASGRSRGTGRGTIIEFN